MKGSLIHWVRPTAEEKAAQFIRRGSRARIPLMTRWRAIVDRMVPFGYEDERGFHYGEQNPLEISQDC
jgi:hypothetical protein